MDPTLAAQIVPLVILMLWSIKFLIFNNATLQATSSRTAHIDFALPALLCLDILFLIVAELLARIVRG